MNGMALLLVLTTPGIEYGWNPGPDGQLEYVIQLEPQLLEQLRGGKSISSDVHPDVRSVRRIVLRVGEGPVPRIAIAPEAMDDSTQATAQPRGATGNARTNNDRTSTQRQPGANDNRRPSATIQGPSASPSGASGRSAPPLLRNSPSAATIEDGDANESDSFETEVDYDQQQYGQFTLEDDATEDGGGAYGNVPRSRYSDGVSTDNSTADPLWSRWQQSNPAAGTDGRWRESTNNPPVVESQDAPPDPDAAWAQGAAPSTFGPPTSNYGSGQWGGQRSDVQPPELANRNLPPANQGTFMSTGYSEAAAGQAPQQTVAAGQQQTAGAGTNNGAGSSASDVTTHVSAGTPAVASPAVPPSSAHDLLKELLLFASLGVNVAAVVIARQYYLRYCILVKELRESETLTA